MLKDGGPVDHDSAGGSGRSRKIPLEELRRAMRRVLWEHELSVEELFAAFDKVMEDPQ